MNIHHAKISGAVLCLLGTVASAQTPPAADPAPQTEPTATTLPQDKPQGANAANSQSPQSRSANKADRLDLDTTIVTGNRELPKVLYIVPWKKAEIGDLPAQPFNTLLDEVLSPVDREVFKREVSYFHTVTKNDAAAPNAGATKPAADGSR